MAGTVDSTADSTIRGQKCSQHLQTDRTTPEIEGLILDIKTGSGAFMRETSDAIKLANSLINTAKATNEWKLNLVALYYCYYNSCHNSFKFQFGRFKSIDR